MIRELAQLPDLLKEVYGDLAKPGVQQVGRALSTVVGLGNTILWPVALLNERARACLENNLNRYRAKLEAVPIDQIAPVPPEVGVPIAERFTYVTDKELSNLYANLLAKASCSATAGLAHPSFVNIVGSLSPDEAVLLGAFRTQNVAPFVTATLESRKFGGGWTVLGDLLTGLETQVALSFPQNIVAYLSNFEGLGLINIRRDVSLSAEVLYNNLISAYKPRYDGSTFDPQEHEVGFQRGKLDVTAFGRLFLNACVN